VVDDPGRLATAPVRLELCATAPTLMPALPPRPLGELVVELGGGRRVASDAIDPAVGLEFPVTVGAPLAPGEPWAIVHAATDARAAAARRTLTALFDAAVARGGTPLPLIVGRIAPLDHHTSEAP
jgi:thymidine phosphorylase